MKLTLSITAFILLLSSNTNAQIRLTSVDPVIQEIAIRNFGSTEVDISGYRLCSHLNYSLDLATDGSISIVTGDLILSADEEVTVNWATTTGLDVEGRDLGLYLPGPAFVGFDDPNQMVDFMQYLGSYPVPSGRENVAVAKGIWTAGNFVNADGPYSYSGNGTDIGVDFWQGAAPACEVTAMVLGNQTTCDPASNTYSQEIIVSYVQEPDTGTLDVNGQSFTISGSPQTITLNGLIADGQAVDVSANFSERPTCVLTENNFFTAAEECTTCAITGLTAGAQTACDPATNTYTQEITVTYVNDPIVESLDVNGQFFPITGSPQTVTLQGLVSDGLDVAVTARFTADSSCALTLPNLFIAPPECAGSCNILGIFAGAQTACDPGTNTYTQEVIVAFENQPGTGTLDVNGQFFAIASSPQTVTLVGLISNGASVNVTASFSDDSTCIFTENNLFNAPADCLPNEPPLASDDNVVTAMNTPIIIDVLINDTDIDSMLDTLSLKVADAAQNGMTEINPDGTITYTPDMDFNGTDFFTYTVEDEHGNISNLATVFITVEILTALDPFDEPELDRVRFAVHAGSILVNVNRDKIKKLQFDIVDISGRSLYRGVYSSNIKEEYRLPIPKTFHNTILVIGVGTNEGNFYKKLYVSN